MQSKRDQVQAHMFIMGRLTSGMLRADPDAPESPQGRTNRGVAISVIIALLIAAGSFVFGLLKPGTKNSWRAQGTLVVNKDTGGRYLYLDERLRPVRNYTSARLLLGADMKTASVGSNSLKGTAHGAPVGIPGAPDDLPAGDALSTGPWQVCSAHGDGRTATALAVGKDIGGRGLGRSEGLLVTGPDKAQYLVWQGSKLRLDVAGGAREALGYGSRGSLPVSAALLNSLPPGPDLAAPDVPQRGRPGPTLGGGKTRIGQVFRASAPGGSARYYVLHKEGLAPVNATVAALLLGDPETKKKAYADGAVNAVPVGADAVIGHLAPGAEGGDTRTDLPAKPPKAVAPGPGESPCVGVRSDKDGTRVSVALADPDSIGRAAQATSEGLTPACTTVNRIVVPPGGGALVHALGAGGTNVGSTVYLVTDNGVKYRVPTADALEALGYNAKQAQRLPSSLLSMLPTGPDLTSSAAKAGRAKAVTPPCGPGNEKPENQVER
ncbi:type VII secretion protein EccB [Streptomyces albus]|uniref:Type VII secretion protein EccB n=1 Tax=Streptomyces albus TaxID=1888 RepID=A0A8H1L7V9_9ACTN|nr:MULTISPECIES: type VII secretion protein EccB [Streptomyces]KPC91015.1 type VII secretion protein EccB [Streptomyces sp. NRRL F-6602]MDI6412725.1 type VII secretion protein EccB [Streptomyces albus]TGG80387.1 type VII secretion protein EccB [Streptomyces albus]UVN54376.1 type VII secretion protein EccB [Streptomyces albus]GHJ25008.1 type VII secretion protein EccB [Streptomyces albus]